MAIRRNMGVIDGISDSELIKIKRQARVYRTIFVRLVNIVSMLALFLALYYYRAPMSSFLSEMHSAYHSLYKEVRRVNDIFGDWCNKRIEAIEIHGLKYVDKQDIVSAAYVLDLNDKLKMRSSIADMHRHMLEIPIIDSLTVRRVLWQKKLIIDVKEKEIIAVVRNKLTDKTLLLDDSGETVDYASAGKFDHLPIVEDSDNPKKVIPIVHYLREKSIIGKVYGFAMVSDRRWNIRFKNNLIVKLPAKDWKSAIDVMMHIDEKVDLFDKDNVMSYIDLRIPGKIFLK